MKITITPELLKALRRKESKTIVFNFSESMIRICSDEKLISGSTVSVFYHVKCIPGSYDEGCWVLSIHEFTQIKTLLRLIKVEDVVQFTIEQNTTDELTRDGYFWEMLDAKIYRNSGDLHLRLENCISKVWQNSKERHEWREQRVNEFVQY